VMTDKGVDLLHDGKGCLRHKYPSGDNKHFFSVDGPLVDCLTNMDRGKS